MVRVTRSVLFRARFRITWKRRDVPRLFPEIGILRAVTSHGISPTSYWIEVQFPLAISQNARAHSHFPYVSSSTVRGYENSVVTTTTTTTMVVGYLDSRRSPFPSAPIVISKISDCYSTSNGTLAKFVVSRTLM